jgi:uncharacterized protein (TIGR02145 family)
MKKISYFAAIAAFATVLFTSCEDPNNSGTKTDPSTIDEGVVINGVKWATRNIAAPGHFTDKTTDVGMFYQWNRKIGWSSTDPMTNSNGGTTWDSTVPEGTEWETANDPSPAGWRVPTYDELRTLLNTEKVTSEWTTQNGVNGRLFTDLQNGNTLFLPAAGYRGSSDGTLLDAGSGGVYWSTQRNSDKAESLVFFSVVAYTYDFDCRYGFSVRCAAE